jgi:fibronectin-binding autotransporter adhesin
MNGKNQTVASLQFYGGTSSSLLNRIIQGGGTLTVAGGISYETNTGSHWPSTISGGTLDLNGQSQATFSIVDHVNSTGDLVISSVIQNGGINKTQTGVLTLSGANIFSGDTTITAGTLRLGNSLALQYSTFNDVNAAGTLSFGSLSAATLGGLKGNQNLSIGSIALQVGNNNQSTSYAGVLSGSGSIEKIGTGTLTVNGTNVQNDGGIIISGGTFAINVGDWFGFSSAETVTINAGTLSYQANYSGPTRNPITVTSNGSTIDVGSNFTYAPGVISGIGALNKTGAGTLQLDKTNTFTGATVINGGIITVSQLANGGVNSNIGASTSAASNLVFGGGTLQYTGSSAASTDRLFTIGDAAGNSATIDASGGSVGTLSFTNGGAIAFGNTNAHTLTLTGSNTGSNTLSASIGDNTGATSLIKSGGGTWVLSGANTYSGGTTVSNGLLQLNSATALGSSSGSLAVDAVLNLNGNSIGVGNLSGGSTGKIWNNGPSNAVTFTIGNGNNGGGNYAGIIADNNAAGPGTVALTKTGTGAITLSGTNTYTGATTVNGGSLFVNGSLASGSAVAVNNSGTILGGTGTINGPVSVNANAAILGGTGSTGQTLTVAGNLTLTSNSIIELALGPSGTHSTLARTGGTWSFQLNQAFTFINLGATATTYDNIITGLAGPVAPSTWTITNPGWTGIFTFDGGVGPGNIDLTLVAAPEPSTWIAAALALGAAVWTQRRRLFAKGPA